MSRGVKIGLWILIGAVVVGLFVVTGARRLRKVEVQSIESVQEEEGIPVDVVRSRILPVEDWREFVGVAEGYEQIDLVAPSRTRVDEVHARVGEEVPVGRVLISLDPYDPAHLAMNLRTTQAQYETARQDSIRLEALFEKGAVSQQDLDHVRASTEAARAHYLTARRAVELDTPIAGIVTAIYVEGGDYAADEQTLATVASYDRIRVRLELSESEHLAVRGGQPVRLHMDSGRVGTSGCPPGQSGGGMGGDAGPVLEGSVIRTALSADPTTRLFSVQVVLDNPDRLLRPGTLVTPRILVASSDDQPVVPPVVLVKHDGQELIYVVDDSQGHPAARLREVIRGVENDVWIAIASGLGPGQQVVVWGQNKLEDGVKVKIHADLTEEYYGKETR